MTIEIMMPFYGDPAQFRSAVESIVAQADPNWTLTVIDDVYPDLSCGEWLLALGDPRVRYVRNETNLGVAGNFRKSVELATASHTAIMGCDDLMLPGYVGVMHELIERYPDAAIFQPGVTVIDDAGQHFLPLADKIKRRLRLPATVEGTVYEGERLVRSLLNGNWTYFPSICWQTSTLKRFDFRPEFGVVLDLDLQIRILLDGGRFVLSDAPAFQYRRHAQSVSSSSAVDGSRFDEEARFFSETARTLDAKGWKRAAQTARVHLTSRLNALSTLPKAVLGADWQGARTLLRHAVRSDASSHNQHG